VRNTNSSPSADTRNECAVPGIVMCVAIVRSSPLLEEPAKVAYLYVAATKPDHKNAADTGFRTSRNIVDWGIVSTLCHQSFDACRLLIDDAVQGPRLLLLLVTSQSKLNKFNRCCCCCFDDDNNGVENEAEAARRRWLLLFPTTANPCEPLTTADDATRTNSRSVLGNRDEDAADAADVDVVVFVIFAFVDVVVVVVVVVVVTVVRLIVARREL